MCFWRFAYVIDKNFPDVSVIGNRRCDVRMQDGKEQQY